MNTPLYTYAELDAANLADGHYRKRKFGMADVIRKIDTAWKRYDLAIENADNDGMLKALDEIRELEVERDDTYQRVNADDWYTEQQAIYREQEEYKRDMAETYYNY